MNAYHVAGGVFALWALLVSALGVTREDFPGRGAEKIVGVVSILLMAATIGAAIYTGVTEKEDEEEHEKGEPEAALVLPR